MKKRRVDLPANVYLKTLLATPLPALRWGFGKTQRRVIVFLLLLLLALSQFAIIPYLIDREAIRNEMITSFKALTGLDLEVQGETSIAVIPTPRVTINSVKIYNIPGASRPFFMTIRLMDAELSLKSLFSKKPEVERITLQGVQLNLERLKDGRANWRELAFRLPDQSTLSSATAFDVPVIRILESGIEYLDSVSEETLSYQHVNVDVVNGGMHAPSKLKMNLQFGIKTLNLEASVGNEQGVFSTGEAPADLKITIGKNTIKYNGNIGYKQSRLHITGNTSVESEDVTSWVDIFRQQGKDPLGSSYIPLPLTAKSAIVTEQDRIIFPDVVIEGPIAKGKLEMAWLQPMRLELQGKMQFIDLQSIFDSRFFSAQKIAQAQKQEEETPLTYALKRTTDVGFEMRAKVQIEKMLYNSMPLENGTLEMDMANEEMVISQAAISLPGNARMVFTGLGKEAYRGYSFEGQLDVVGDDFVEAIKIFRSKGLVLPADEFKRFRLRSNTIISSRDIRFSELTLRIENMGIMGGIVAVFGDRPLISAALRFSALNADKFVELWGLGNWRVAFDNQSIIDKKEGFLSAWLRTIDYDMSVNASLEGFTLGGNIQPEANFKFLATNGRMALTDIATTYNETILAGGLAVDVRHDLPYVEINMAADKLDTKKFFGLSEVIKSSSEDVVRKGGVWSREVFDWGWLELLNASFHLRVGHFKHRNFEMHDANLKGGIQTRTLLFESIEANVFGGIAKGKMGIVGEKIPRFFTEMDIDSLPVENVVTLMPMFNGMSGKVSINSKLNASGIDMASWISSLEGKINFNGRDIMIQGFNMPGIVRAVGYVRTVADILNVVRRAWPGGDTTFNTVDGAWVVEEGTLKSPRMRMMTDIAGGYLNGEVDLLNWRAKGRIMFELTSLDANRPPSMTINFAGNLDSLDTSLDTKMLEQYVTNKTSERMLKQYDLPSQ